MDHCGLSVIAQCSALFPASRDLQEADARLDPADGAHTVVSHCKQHSLLPVWWIFAQMAGWAILSVISPPVQSTVWTKHMAHTWWWWFYCGLTRTVFAKTPKQSRFNGWCITMLFKWTYLVLESHFTENYSAQARQSINCHFCCNQTPTDFFFLPCCVLWKTYMVFKLICKVVAFAVTLMRNMDMCHRKKM